MENLNKVAYCGLFCGACEIYIATQNDTIEQYAKSTGIPVDLLRCNGCRSNELSLYCRNCAMKKCSLKKWHFTCATCEEFPCSVLQAFESDQHTHHKGVIDELQRIKEIGNEKWLIEQENRWNCKKCGTSFSWYEERCLHCHEEVVGYKL